MKPLFADGAYDRLKRMDKGSYLEIVVEIIRRSDDQNGSKVLPLCGASNERSDGWSDGDASCVITSSALSFAGHDHGRHGRHQATPKRSPLTFQTDLKNKPHLGLIRLDGWIR